VSVSVSVTVCVCECVRVCVCVRVSVSECVLECECACGREREGVCASVCGSVCVSVYVGVQVPVGRRLPAQRLPRGTRPAELISLLFSKSFGKRQFPQKCVNSFVILVIVDDTLTDSWGS